MAHSTRPAAVSRYLSDGPIGRSVERGIHRSAGFIVRGVDASGDTVVRYHIGDRNLHMNPERRREITRDAIDQMERHLSKRYTVTMFEPDEGTNYRLTVRPLEA